jgi:hypothetical protein
MDIRHLRLAFAVSFCSHCLKPFSNALTNDSTGYEPKELDCSGQFSITRSAPNLSVRVQESVWLKTRQTPKLKAMQDRLQRIDVDDFDPSSFLKNFETQYLPNIAISISGCSYRALMSDTGALSMYLTELAFDFYQKLERYASPCERREASGC